MNWIKKSAKLRIKNSTKFTWNLGKYELSCRTFFNLYTKREEDVVPTILGMEK